MKHSEILEQAKDRLELHYELFGRAFVCHAVQGVRVNGGYETKKEIVNFINDSMKKDAKNIKDKYFINEYGLAYWLYLKGCVKADRIVYEPTYKYFSADINYEQLQNYRESFIDELIRIYKSKGK